VRLSRPATTAAVLLLLATAPPATAQSTSECLSDPSVAALDQYCEQFPQLIPLPLGWTGQPVGKPLRMVLAPDVVQRLRRAGGASRALLSLPAAQPTSQDPQIAARDEQMMLDARDVVASGSLDAQPGVPRRVIAAVTATGETVGGAFRWAFVLSTLVLVGTAWVGYRRRTAP
jgi:hypothetical protein